MVANGMAGHGRRPDHSDYHWKLPESADVRYVSGQQDGVISSDKLALPVTPDSRIKHQLQQGRLWVWMPEQPGLVETLRSKSRGSALIGIFQNGQLTWLSGTATGLTPPAGITAGSVVYVN